MVGEVLSRVVFLDPKTRELAEGDFPDVDPEKLRQGMNIKVRVPGKGKYYFKIVKLEKGFVTRAWVKRVPFHYTDLIKLVVIVILAKVVFQYYADFFASQ